MRIELRELTKEVRDETGIDLDTVREVSRYMFKCVADTMEAGKYESVYLQYLGTFHVKDSRLDQLERRGVNLSLEGKNRVEQFRSKKYENNR